MSILNKSSILVIRTVRQNVCQHVRYLSLSRTVWNSKKGENSVTQTTENQQLQTSFSQKSKRLLSVKSMKLMSLLQQRRMSRLLPTQWSSSLV